MRHIQAVAAARVVKSSIYNDINATEQISGIQLQMLAYQVTVGDKEMHIRL